MEDIRPHIIHLEDSKSLREAAQKAVEISINNGTYHGYGNLDDFVAGIKIPQNQATLGYIIDGNFPGSKNGTEAFLGADAIRILRETIADQTRVVIYSGEPLNNFGIYGTAEGVDYVNKGDGSVYDVLRKIQQTS